MVSVPGIYKNGEVILLEEIPQIQQARVIVTVLEEWPILPFIEGEKPSVDHWLGSLSHTAKIVGDIVQPVEETLSDWDVLRP
jgi:hypothetical protein